MQKHLNQVTIEESREVEVSSEVTVERRQNNPFQFSLFVLASVIGFHCRPFTGNFNCMLDHFFTDKMWLVKSQRKRKDVPSLDTPPPPVLYNTSECLLKHCRCNNSTC